MSMARDLSNNVVQALRHGLKTGELLANEEVVRMRIKKCDGCSHKSGFRCTKCGCYISLKTAVLTAKCPEGLW